MFGLIAATSGDVSASEVAAMAAALRGSSRPVATYRDAGGRAGVVAGAVGILAEDQFDAQPLIEDDLAFAAQARIDNRDEILAKLGVPRERWATLADSSALHLAYRQWGEDCVQHVTGDYAFAAWHRGSGRVVAATDHIGTARLYYALCAGKLVVSTQLGAVLANPSVPRDLNFDTLGLLVAPKAERGTTPYKVIQLLPGGGKLIFDAGALACRQWWTPDTASRARYRDPRDYAMQAREHLDAAVSACLRTAGGVAATVSGGLDSTLVAATAALQLRERGRTLATYTSVPEPEFVCETRPGWENDDSRYVRALAAMHGNMLPTFVTPAGLCTLDVISAVHAASHTPVRNGSNLIWISQICEAASAQGARVILNGFKGNATVSVAGYGAIAHLFRSLHWSSALHLARQGARAGASPFWRTLARELAGQPVRNLINRLRGNDPAAPRYAERLLTPSFRAAHAAELDARTEPLASQAGRIAFMMNPAHGWGADPLVQWGVELRDPTADRRLIECLLSFPPEAFLVGGHQRGLARALGEGRVPDVVRLRHTKGEQTPELAAIVAAHAPTYRAALERVARSPAFCAIVDIAELRAMFDRVCARPNTRFDAITLSRALDVGLFIAGAE